MVWHPGIAANARVVVVSIAVAMLVGVTAIGDATGQERVDPGCMKSLPVKEGLFESHRITMSCVLAERSRAGIFQAIGMIEGSQNYAKLERQISRLKEEVSTAAKRRVRADVAAILAALARSIHDRSIVSSDFARAGAFVRPLHGAGI